jgi:hypothetical protein
MINLSFTNTLRFKQGQTYTIQDSLDTCKVILKENISPTECHIETDRDITAKIISDPSGTLYITGKCLLKHNKYYTGTLHKVLHPATLRKFSSGPVDSTGRPVNTRSVTQEVYIHIRSFIGVKSEERPDGHADISKRTGMTLTSFNLALANLLELAGDTYLITEIHPTNYGISTVSLLKM